MLRLRIIQSRRKKRHILSLRIKSIQFNLITQAKALLYSTANDPQPQMIPRPQMILDRKWSPKLTENDPERKVGMA